MGLNIKDKKLEPTAASLSTLSVSETRQKHWERFSDFKTYWHGWLFLTNWETLIMTFRVSDWHSKRDLDSIRNSCIHNHLSFFINHENLKRAFVWSQRCFAFLIFYCWIGFWFWKVFLCFLWLFSPFCKNPLVAPGLCSSEKRWFLEQYLSQLCPQWVFL